MPKTRGSIFNRVEYERHHSPSASKTFAWSLANGSGRPPRELTDVPYSIVLTPGTTTPSGLPHNTIDSPSPREADSPFADREAVTATQGPGLFVLVGRRPRSFESFKSDTQLNRLVDFHYITLQTNDKHSLRNEIVRPMTYQNATIGVYSAAYDPVLKEMGPYRLEEHTNMNVKVGRPQGAWVITVCEPDGDGDGKESISKSGESIKFWATVSRGDKGHYTDDGTLVFQDGLAWNGLKAVEKKEEGASQDRSEAQSQDWQEEVGEKGQADESSGTQVPEEDEASFSEKDRDWYAGDEKTPDPSTKTRATTSLGRWFGGRPSKKRLPRSTSDND
jgi:hypothetical protein